MLSFRPDQSEVEELRGITLKLALRDSSTSLEMTSIEKFSRYSSQVFNASTIVSRSDKTLLPIKTSSVSLASTGSNSQRPATKLKSCAASEKRMKPFARITFADSPFTKRSKQSREKILSELNVSDSNSR